MVVPTLRPEIPANELAQYISYNPETGIIRRARVSGWRGRFKIGELAGGPDKADGYWKVKIEGRTYGAHRIAYALMTGEWPTHEVDHINGKRDDNRWENLRHATRPQNRWNTGPRIDNTTGFKGVHPVGYKFRAFIQYKKRKFDLGLFETAQQASDAYVKKQKELHGEFARIGKEALERLKRTDLLTSGLQVEWQSWPHGKPRPDLWACGSVKATAEFFDQMTALYPDLSVRLSGDSQPSDNAPESINRAA